MKVNFLLENYGDLKYVGCSTVAEYLRKGLEKQGIKVAMNSNEKGFDVAHAHTFGPSVFLRKGTGKVSVLSAHSTPSINVDNVIGPRIFWEIFYRLVYDRFEYLLPVSKTSQKELEQLGFKSKMYFMPNGVDFARFRYSKKMAYDFRKRYGLGNKFIVLNVAQKTIRKGLPEFVETARKMPDATFVWTGTLPYGFATAKYFWVRSLLDNPPKNVIFMNRVENIVGAYSAADAFFTPSHSESFGLTVVEAAACRLPVIANDLPVFRELFGNAVLYAKSPAGYALHLKKMMRRSARNAWSRKAFRMSRKYSNEKVCKRLASFYRMVAK